MKKLIALQTLELQIFEDSRSILPGDHLGEIELIQLPEDENEIESEEDIFIPNSKKCLTCPKYLECLAENIEFLSLTEFEDEIVQA